jgi:hypothetical protein
MTLSRVFAGSMKIFTHSIWGRAVFLTVWGYNNAPIDENGSI